uniref:Patatin like phospholipase domain containing 5 n=1 Tax=Bos mutus grunniens TaxID=30521 RepID=A0A8B9XPC4_BOSMU
TSCFEKEGSWSRPFGGAAFLGLYHVGVIHRLRQPARLLRGPSRFYGSSSGALIAVSIVSGLSVDSPSTNGTVDICPQSSSASIHEMNAFSANFQISTKNLFRGITCLIPSSPEVMADSCRQGYLDALRFLERRGLTKEPVLWSLVSKEPPAPADGTPDAAHDRGLSLNWAVPNVLVKDVPDFEQLSPELEAALKKACMRDPSAWASFCHSGPGWALTYLLLPFEYVYFRSRRLVEWLPDMPADLWWMQGLLRSLALEVCSRTKDQLLRLVGLLVTSSLQPKTAPPKDLAKEPRSAHQA